MSKMQSLKCNLTRVHFLTSAYRQYASNLVLKPQRLSCVYSTYSAYLQAQVSTDMLG